MSTEPIDDPVPDDPPTDETPTDDAVVNDEYPTGRVAERLPDAIPGWVGAIGLGVGTFVAAMGLQFAVLLGFFVVAILAGVASGDVGTTRTAGTMIGWGMLAGYLVWIPIVGAIVWFFDLPLPVEIPDGRGAIEGAVAFVVLAALAVGSYQLLPYNPNALAGGSTANVDPGAIAVAGTFLAFVVGGAIEEFLFRGTIQSLFRDEFSAVAAIVGANVLFVPLHVFNNLGQPLVTMAVNVSIVALLGVVNGILYERHRNLAIPAAVHGIYNAVVVGVALLL